MHMVSVTVLQWQTAMGSLQVPPPTGHGEGWNCCQGPEDYPGWEAEQ